MDMIMICEYNPQPDLCYLEYRAVQWLGPNGPHAFGGIEYMYPSIRSIIPVIIPKEYNVYNYDLWI